MNRSFGLCCQRLPLPPHAPACPRRSATPQVRCQVSELGICGLCAGAHLTSANDIEYPVELAAAVAGTAATIVTAPLAIPAAAANAPCYGPAPGYAAPPLAYGDAPPAYYGAPAAPAYRAPPAAPAYYAPPVAPAYYGPPARASYRPPAVAYCDTRPAYCAPRPVQFGPPPMHSRQSPGAPRN